MVQVSDWAEIWYIASIYIYVSSLKVLTMHLKQKILTDKWRQLPKYLNLLNTLKHLVHFEHFENIENFENLAKTLF